MIDYMDAVRDEYIHHRFPYRDEVSVKTWTSKVEELKKLPEEIFFILTRKRQFDKHGRVYAQELEYKRSCKLNYYESPRPYAYDLIRRLAIPEVSYLLFTKEEDADGLHLLTKLFYDPNKD